MGKITVPGGVNIWPHELKTAEALARAGHDVEFVVRDEGEYARSADVIISGVIWEMKAPKSSNIKAVERNLKRARWQSQNIIFDSRRMKDIPDSAIERELRKWSRDLSGIRHLIFVNRRSKLIEIL